MPGMTGNGASIAFEPVRGDQMLYDVSKSIPEPPEPLGKIVDERGDTLTPTKEASRGLMVKADEKLSEKVSLSKGTILLLAVGPAILMLVFSYGGSLIGWARDDQSKVKDIQAIQASVESMNKAMERIEGKFEKLDERLREQERFQDKAGGYKLGKEDAQEGK